MLRSHGDQPFNTSLMGGILYEIAINKIITSYKLTINMSVTYQKYIQYPVDHTNNLLESAHYN